MRSVSKRFRSIAGRAGRAAVCLWLVAVVGAVVSAAVRAGDPARGKQLFERPFGFSASRQFNAKSCADCHRMAGVGGAGQQQFNARSIGIEELRMPRSTTPSQLSSFLSSLYPGFVGSDGTVSTVAALPHFGGSSKTKLLRSNLLLQLDGRRDEAGGPATHADLQAELRSEIRYASDQLAITAKAFHRNTPPLFGAGLIDAITDEQILHQARRQRQKRSVSGRPATLSSGGIGRFGWRGNVATLKEFTRQACMNELGLRVAQDPRDQVSATANRLISDRQLLGFSGDLSQDSLDSLTEFIDSLPAPMPILPTDPDSLKVAVRGEKLFKEIGCSICHVPDMGPAQQIYSDLLLHDMGEELRGASIAEPYIYEYDEFVSQPTVVAVRTGYYGAAVPLIPGNRSNQSSAQSSTLGNRVNRGTRDPIQAIHRPYQKPPESIQLVPLDSREFVVRSAPGRRFPGGQQRVVRQVKVRRNRVRPTNVSQEWRTAPLWGLRDSAPYLHDGRAATVEEAIKLHGGEGRSSLRRYERLDEEERHAVIAFLDTLAAPADAPQPDRLSAEFVR